MKVKELKSYSYTLGAGRVTDPDNEACVAHEHTKIHNKQ